MRSRKKVCRSAAAECESRRAEESECGSGECVYKQRRSECAKTAKEMRAMRRWRVSYVMRRRHAPLRRDMFDQGDSAIPPIICGASRHHADARRAPSACDAAERHDACAQEAVRRTPLLDC